MVTAIDADGMIHMRMRAECVPCQLRRAIYESSLVQGSDEIEVMKAAVKVFKEYFPPPEGMSNNEVSSLVKEAVYNVLGTNDPQAGIKQRSNRVALDLLPVVEQMVESSEDPFRTAVLAAVVGNVMEFGISGSAVSPEHLTEIFHEHLKKGLYVDHTDRIREMIEEVDEVLFLSDNAGEIVFDGLLIKEIKRLGPRVTLMVRGEPILNDATMVDVKELGLDNIADRVTTTGSYGVGVVFSRVPQEVKNEIFNARFIVAKGMGNYEGFADLELPPTAFLLRTKCGPVAEDIGFPKDRNISYLRV